MAFGKWLKQRVTPPKKIREDLKKGFAEYKKKVMPPKKVRNLYKRVGKAALGGVGPRKAARAAGGTLLDLFGHYKRKK